LIGLGLLLFVGTSTTRADPNPRLRVGVFACEVTPPVGHPLCGGWIRPLETVDDPLLAKGLVLAEGRHRYVLCAVDWCLLQAAPDGVIDPWLRTVTLFDEERPLVRLHYYTTHPMSFYGDGRATSDTVGLARRQLEQAEGVPQIYFTGYGGNITAGKYNDGSPAARAALTQRIHLAMKSAIAATRRESVRHFAWQTTSVPFYPDKQHLLWWRDSQGREHPITKTRDWQQRRRHILGAMQQVMGPLPPPAKVPLDVQVEKEILEPKYRRLKISFAAEAGDRVPAYLLIPLERS
jgi:hypothetical protein